MNRGIVTTLGRFTTWCRFVILAVVVTFVSVGAAADDLVGRASVIDGDTLEIHGTRIRLHGIDAPESSQTCHRAGEPWRCGQEAALRLDELVRDKTVSCRETDRDRYGRTVAVCHAAGRDLNEQMVLEGLALAYRRYSRDYVAAEEQAREEGRGIWASEFVEPWLWRRGQRLGGPAASEFRDRDCGDFASHADAQAFFDQAGPGDPHKLDGDGNGLACEGLL